MQNFFFSPNPPVIGQNVSGAITAKDNYVAALTGGSVTVSVSYMGVTLLNQTSDLCSLLSQAPFPGVPQCPVPPVALKTIAFNQPIPNVIPPGPYTGQVYVHNCGAGHTV